MTRHDGRTPSQLRPVTFTPGFAPNATGSVLVSTGETRVICSAMVEEAVPRWMKEQQVPGGWVTAEIITRGGDPTLFITASGALSIAPPQDIAGKP